MPLTHDDREVEAVMLQYRMLRYQATLRRLEWWTRPPHWQLLGAAGGALLGLLPLAIADGEWLWWTPLTVVVLGLSWGPLLRGFLILRAWRADLARLRRLVEDNAGK